MTQETRRAAAERIRSTRMVRANLALLAAGCLVGTAAPMHAQETGVSVAQPVLSDNSEAPQAAPTPVKPSAAIPATPATTAPNAQVVYGSYVPYHMAGSDTAHPSTPQAGSTEPFDPDAQIVTQESIDRVRPIPAAAVADTEGPDSRIVTRVPVRPGEISDGTLIRVRLGETISTVTTQPGTRFTAEVAEPVMQQGRVYIPEGSVMEGRVTSVHSGSRISGGASIHLEPERVTLPDGTVYRLNARVIDTSSQQNTRVDEEGTILRRENAKDALAAGGLATGGAMAAGAMVAGVPGALIGAGVGAGATAVVWLRQDRQAQLPKDLGLVFSLTAPLSVGASAAALPALQTTVHAPGE